MVLPESVGSSLFLSWAVGALPVFWLGHASDFRSSGAKSAPTRPRLAIQSRDILERFSMFTCEDNALASSSEVTWPRKVAGK